MSTMTAPMSATAKQSISLATPKDPLPPTVSGRTSSEVTSERIRARAFEIYQARNGNGGTGDAVSDWAQAERELNGSGLERSVASDIESKSQARGERLLAGGGK